MVKKRRRVKGNQAERDWSERAVDFIEKLEKVSVRAVLLALALFEMCHILHSFAVPFSLSYEIYGGGGYVAQRSRMDEIEGAGT